MPGGFNPNAVYQQIGTDTGQIIYLQGGVFFDINGNVVSVLKTNGPSGIEPVEEASVVTGAKVMVNGDTIFTAVGDCQILNLFSDCHTANDATASTMQYSITPTGGIAQTISGVSGSLANLAFPADVVMGGNAAIYTLATAPTIFVNGGGLGTSQQNGVLFPDGVLKLVIGGGSTVGTWTHYVRYRPLEPGAKIVANQ